MKLVVSQKTKKELFVAIFQILKGCTTSITILFNDNDIYIQGMDKAHVCLFDVKIMSDWFSVYEKGATDSSNVSIDTFIFHTILNSAREEQDIVMYYAGDPDAINIDLVSHENKGEFNKYFKIPLANLDHELLEIPNLDYDAEFSLTAKKMHDITSHMSIFGDNINVNCSNEEINLTTVGVLGEMMVKIPIEDLTEYSIAEDETVHLTYSLNYIHKMCITTKLSAVVEFFVSSEFPMKIKYDLGGESRMIFYLAPKIED